MDNEKSTMGLTTERKPGGLYRNVKISVKTADRLILVGIVVLIACVVFAISHAGFTVTFDTNGGSQIENQKVMHGQLVNVCQRGLCIHRLVQRQRLHKSI